MKVSIITATYNSAKTLRACLQSVAVQDCLEQIEHIIVDGQSSDSTLAIVNDFPHIKQVHSEPDEGIYDAFNKGLEWATGDIIYYLNSDDVLLHAGAIRQVLDSFSDGLEYVSAKVMLKDPTTQAMWLQNSKLLNFKDISFQHPCHQGFFVRRDWLRQAGGFPRYFDIAADSYIMLKAITSVSGCFLNEPVACFERGGFSSDLKHADKLQAELKDIYQMLSIEGAGTLSVEACKAQFSQCKSLLASVLNKQPLTATLNHQRIAIFGTGQMSVLIAQILAANDAELVCFVTTTGGQSPCMGRDVIALAENLPVDVVINAIEGEHYKQIEDMIVAQNPGITVLRWFDIYE
ncbi:glycosyltransferase [Bowmanella sp. Y26]|uniref:glycosyltransferase family 2 protein n=1 Tax=Bowmanella yangjiangensis TaxID=2811230 RepID=UPI001BDCD529|nr:glycosyltransferase family 2 protein [Bowmanella yangjiangensis]MBT1062878.1 glycosyltransferase [Bowmanella yangjiangensis]